MLYSIDYGVIIVYFCCILGIGFIGMKLAKSQEDYLVAGRRLNSFMFFGCMAAVIVGGGATMGSAKLGYQYGLGGIILDACIGIGLIILGLIIAPKLAKMKAVSINEIVLGTYGKTAKLYSSILTFIYEFISSVLNVIAMGVVFNVALGWSSSSAMIFGGSIVIVYTFLGGMWSVSMTDIIQFCIKTIGVVILAPVFALSAVGGWGDFTAHIPAARFNIMSMGAKQTLSSILLYIPGAVIAQETWQRVFTAKTHKIANIGTVAAGLFALIYGLATVLIGMCVFIRFPKIDPQNAFVVGILNFVPSGIKGFILAALLAATMSCASGTILAGSTIMYNDIYKEINKNARQENATKLNRLFVLLLGIGIFVVAFGVKDIVVAMNLAYDYLSGCVFVPVLASFILKKFSHKAGLYSLAASSVLVTGTLVIYGIESYLPILFGIISGTIVYVVVNFVDKNKQVPDLKMREILTKNNADL